jgi:hypothetical protein
MHVRCDTCRLLSASLQDTRDRLVVVTVRLAEHAGMRRPELFNTNLHESQSLRMECTALKAELEHHKGQHAPSSNTDLAALNTSHRRDSIVDDAPFL